MIERIWAVARQRYAEHAGYGSSDAYSLAQRMVWWKETQQRLLHALEHRATMPSVSAGRGVQRPELPEKVS
jgi:hypothetical protein